MKTNYIIAAIVIAGIAYWYFYVSGRKLPLGLADFDGDNGTGGNGTGDNGTGSDGFVYHIPPDNTPPDIAPPYDDGVNDVINGRQNDWLAYYSARLYPNTNLERVKTGTVTVIALTASAATIKAIQKVQVLYPNPSTIITITSVTAAFSRN